MISVLSFLTTGVAENLRNTARTNKVENIPMAAKAEGRIDHREEKVMKSGGIV